MSKLIDNLILNFDSSVVISETEIMSLVPPAFVLYYPISPDTLHDNDITIILQFAAPRYGRTDTSSFSSTTSRSHDILPTNHPDQQPYETDRS